MSRFEWLEMPKDDNKGKQEKKVEEKDLVTHYMTKAESELHLGNFEKALKYYSRALGEDSNIEKAWFWQVWILIHLNELKQAETWVNKALEKFPDSIQLLAAKGIIRGLRFDFEKAYAYVDNAVTKKGNHKYAWLARGYVQLIEKPKLNYKYASKCFMKAVESGNKDWWFLINLANSYIELGYPEDAIEIIQKTKTMKGNSPYIFYVYSKACMEQGMYNAALENIEKALAFSPQFQLGRDYRDYIEKNSGVWYAIKKFFKRKL